MMLNSVERHRAGTHHSPSVAPARPRGSAHFARRGRPQTFDAFLGSAPAQPAHAWNGPQEVSGPSVLRRAIRIDERQARWLGREAGLLYKCRTLRSNAPAWVKSPTLPCRAPGAAHMRQTGASGCCKGLQHVYMQAGGESDDGGTDGSWMGGGAASPDGAYSGSIHKYLVAQKNMHVNQKRARSAYREMVCAVPHVPTASVAQRRGVKPKTARSPSCSSLSFPLALAGFPDGLQEDSTDEIDVSTPIDDCDTDMPALAQVQHPAVDTWFPEDGNEVAHFEEWVEVEEGEDTTSTSSGDETLLDEPVYSRYNAEADELAEDSIQIDAVQTISATELDEEDQMRCRPLRVQTRVGVATQIAGARRELVQPTQRRLVRPGTAGASVGVCESPLGANDEPRNLSARTGPRGPGTRPVSNASIQTPLRLRNAADCENAIESLLQARHANSDSDTRDFTRCGSVVADMSTSPSTLPKHGDMGFLCAGVDARRESCGKKKDFFLALEDLSLAMDAESERLLAVPLPPCLLQDRELPRVLCDERHRVEESRVGGSDVGACMSKGVQGEMGEWGEDAVIVSPVEDDTCDTHRISCDSAVAARAGCVAEADGTGDAGGGGKTATWARGGSSKASPTRYQTRPGSSARHVPRPVSATYLKTQYRVQGIERDKERARELDRV